MATLDDLWAMYDACKPRDPEPEPPSGAYTEYFCPCGGSKVFIPNDLPVCTECGRVEFHYLSEDAEWTSGIDNDGIVSDGARCGGPIDNTFFSTGWHMGTRITGGSEKMARIHFHMGMNHKDRSLYHAYADIEMAAKKLGCSDTMVDAAKVLYRKFSETKLTRGDVRKGVKANCLFIVCKQYGFPRTTKEIADAFGINTKDVGRTTSIVTENVETQASRITMPSDVVIRIFQTLNIEDHKAKRQCVKLCEAIQKNPKLMGKTPSGIACAVIYHILGDHVSKVDICNSTGISTPTLNKLAALVREVAPVDK